MGSKFRKDFSVITEKLEIIIPIDDPAIVEFFKKIEITVIDTDDVLDLFLIQFLKIILHSNLFSMYISAPLVATQIAACFSSAFISETDAFLDIFSLMQVMDES
jgi:hypothetical protein